jgi:hypothetical protein
MSEQARIDDLINRGTDHQTKFVYGMITISLGTLALSFQFSITLKYFPFLLITSWIFLFVSILFGGWRLYKQPSVYFVNANILQGGVDLARFRTGNIITSDLRRGWTPEELRTAIANGELKVKKHRETINIISKKAVIAYKSQIILLVIGMFFLGCFTSLNYLKID